MEPTITLVVAQLAGSICHASIGAGVVIFLGAIGNILSAARLRRLADHANHCRVVISYPLTTSALLPTQSLTLHVLTLTVLRFFISGTQYSTACYCPPPAP